MQFCLRKHFIIPEFQYQMITVPYENRTVIFAVRRFDIIPIIDIYRKNSTHFTDAKHLVHLTGKNRLF